MGLVVLAFANGGTYYVPYLLLLWLFVDQGWGGFDDAAGTNAELSCQLQQISPQQQGAGAQWDSSAWRCVGVWGTRGIPPSHPLF